MRYLSKSPAWLHPTSLSENTCELKSSVALTRVHRRTEALHPENICKVALLKPFLHSLSVHVCVALLVWISVIDNSHSWPCLQFEVSCRQFYRLLVFFCERMMSLYHRDDDNKQFPHFVHIFHFFCDPQTSINQFQAPKKYGHLSKGMFTQEILRISTIVQQNFCVGLSYLFTLCSNINKTETV